MAHRTIERIIGRLLTDEDLRLKFKRSPKRTLAELAEHGWELTRIEVEACLAQRSGCGLKLPPGSIRVFSAAASRTKRKPDYNGTSPALVLAEVALRLSTIRLS